MTSNPKNILQEYYQARKESLPIYDTKKDGCMWVSIVTVFGGREFTSNHFPCKKTAEKNGASIAYDAIIRLEEAECIRQVCSLQTQTNVYIDVENQSRAAMDILKLLKKDPLPTHIMIIFVMSVNCAIKERLKYDIDKLHLDNVKLLITQSRLSNAADTLIIIEASKSDADVLILSNDKFAVVFKEVMNELPSINQQHRLIAIATTFVEFKFLVF